MIHVTCRLTAKNGDQLRNPTLGSRVWATFTFLCMYVCILLDATDAHLITNIESKNRITYSSKENNQKLFYLTKLQKYMPSLHVISSDTDS